MGGTQGGGGSGSTGITGEGGRAGGGGAVRIIWGAGRAFPATNTGDLTGAPVFTSAQTASAIVGSSFSYQIGALYSPTTYGATGLPPGISVNSGTGLISGTATTTGVFLVTLSATNSVAITTMSLALGISLLDTDGDGMPNAWESANGLSTSVNDALLDPDGDGLSNAAEYNLNKNPQSYDAGTSTSGNTIPAGWNSVADTTNSRAVGATRGELSVDKNGAATYTIPIWVSPGTAGMQPRLSLNYSSQAGAGIAGFGWSIGGLSAITRGPQTLGVDGQARGVTLTGSDRFYLDGQRLVAITGLDGVAGTEYRTEIDSFTRVISYGAAGSGPAWFKAWTKAGLIIEFGNTTKAAFNPGGGATVLTWNVSKVSDTKGNSIRFEYEEDAPAGEHRISEIRYTERAGGDYYAAVLFEYEVRDDFSMGYVAGLPVSTTRRLKRIKSCYSGVAGTVGAAVRTYEIGYVEQAHTSRALLTQIDEIAADGTKYPPLTFSYEPASTGWQTVNGLIPPVVLARDNTKQRGVGFVDLDGDGRPDFVRFHRWNADGGVPERDAWVQRNGSWIVADGTVAGAPDWRLPHTAPADYQPVLAWDEFADFGTRFVDLDGDGRPDLLHGLKKNGAYHSTAYLNNGAGWTRAIQWDLPSGAYLASEGDQKGSSRLIDLDGDGRVDVVWNYDTTNRGALLNNGNGWSTAPGFTPPVKIDGSVVFIDVNGDGLPDELQRWYGDDSDVKGVALNTGSGWQLLTPGTADFNRFVPPFPITVKSSSTNLFSPVGTELVDLNGDGLVDMVWNNPAIGYVGAYFNTGAGWVSTPAAFVPGFKLTDNNTPTGSALFDVNGDGIVDQVVYKETNPNSEAGVYLGTGRGWTEKLPGSDPGLPYFVSRYDTAQAAGMDLVDLDGDGVVDQVWNLFSGGAGARRNNARNIARLQAVMNGFGVAATISYGPLTERDAQGNFTVYDKGGADAPAGSADIIGPTSVVKTVIHDDGIGGQYPMSYRYGGLRTHRIHGALGFKWMRTIDGRTNIMSTTTFKQTYPFIGLPYTTSTISGGTSLTDSIVTHAETTPVHPKVHLVFASNTINTTRDPNGAFVSRTATSIPLVTDVDSNGNVKKLVVDSLDASGNSLGFTRTTISTYSNDEANWFLGRLTKSVVTAAAPGKPTLTRTSGFLYDASTGLLTDEAIEPVFTGNQLYPSSTDLSGYGPNTLRTHYDYDGFGNRTAVRISGLKLQVASNGSVSSLNLLETRSTTLVYDGFGRLPQSTTNAAGHTEIYLEYDQRLGALKQLKGPNGLITAWSYDGFGQKTRETRADGTVTDFRLEWANPGASLVPARAKYFVETESPGTTPSLAFHDALGRTLRKLAINGRGEIIHQDTSYDFMGRGFKTSMPYRNDGSTIHYTETTSYDLLNRPLLVRTPDDAIGAGYVETGYSYNGLVTIATDAKGRVSATTRNSEGWTVGSIRNKGAGAVALDYAATTFDYDAIGNVTGTVASGVATSLTYDARGRKESMTDSHMGTWSYRYSPFGELIWQKDGKAQIVVMSYDVLGRMVGRLEAEGATTWTYDSAPHASPPAGAPATWVGVIGSISAPGGYGETHHYDSFGRPATVARTIDGSNYSISRTYDIAGRPEKTIYPTNFQVRNVYNAFGFLKEVRRADSGRTDLYWQAESYAVDGRVNGEIFGNGVANDRSYSGATGRLTFASIDLGRVTGAPYAIQQLSYTYDAVGNLKTRYDAATGRDERFSPANGDDGYDGLDRLRVHRIVGGATVTVAYDQKGGITNKSDVGAYNYVGYGSHAVSAAGANNYAYDANGNMTSGAGRSLAWTSFNQLQSVSQGGYNSTFTFGAGRERVKQAGHLGTTVYVGGIFEKVTAGSVVENKHYILAPTGRVAVRIERNNATVDTRYFHSDGLGSITAVTDEIGRIVKRFVFDAWGRRVDPATGATITSVTSGKFTRGFTDHEHLDDLGLVHMNGRVYDPVLGRFISADPVIQDTGDSQTYNRYSYCANNPLNSTDPRGYSFFKKWGGQILGGIVAVVVTVVTLNPYLGGSAGGFVSGLAGSLLNGGSIGDAFRAGVIGGAIGLATAGAGQIGNGVLRFAASGAVGGLASEAMGGDFRSGLFSGLATAALAPSIGAAARQNWYSGLIVSSVVGGTASVLGGGKFANGAAFGAFQYLMINVPARAQLASNPIAGAGLAGKMMFDRLIGENYGAAWLNLKAALDDATKKAATALGEVKAEGLDSQINDNKYGHATQMSYLQQKLGLLGAPLIALGGVGYEAYHMFVPGHVQGMAHGYARKAPFFGLTDGQNPLNWLWDTPGDLLGNTIGQINAVLGLDFVQANKSTFMIPGPNYSDARSAQLGNPIDLWERLAPPGTLNPY